MPKIDWIGKSGVVNHHREVAYRLVHCDKGFSAGDAVAGNLLVQGDNLEALRALLPYYAGRVKCIYIDPPYNTGNEGWVYNDRVNSPEIREWLGKVVGGEADDLCRHSKWLCMMYPRLRLLRDFLREDGVIFISIDDNEQHHLRMIMNEIFGENNFLASIVWQHRYGRSNNAKLFSNQREFIIAYRKSPELSHIRTRRSEELNATYSNPDKDPRGEWVSSSYINPAIKEDRPNLVYPIRNPITGKMVNHPTNAWKYGRSTHEEHVKQNMLYWGVNGGLTYPRLKNFLSDSEIKGIVPTDLILAEQGGTTDEGTRALQEISGNNSEFNNPKPLKLVRELIAIAEGGQKDSKDGIIMDSFAGSGTTAHAVLQQNKADGGNRKFVLVEMDKNISENITAKRIAKAIKGYKNGDKTIAPLGGGFHFCTLGTSLFDENGNIGGKVKFADLAAHIFFSETGTPIAKRAKTPLLGVCDNRAIYLLFNGVMGDNNALTIAALHSLPPPPQNGMTRVIYAESTLLSKERLAREKIEFRQIPYKIRLR